MLPDAEKGLNSENTTNLKNRKKTNVSNGIW